MSPIYLHGMCKETFSLPAEILYPVINENEKLHANRPCDVAQTEVHDVQFN
jgi:hypothetical protein